MKGALHEHVNFSILCNKSRKITLVYLTVSLFVALTSCDTDLTSVSDELIGKDETEETIGDNDDETCLYFVACGVDSLQFCILFVFKSPLL